MRGRWSPWILIASPVVVTVAMGLPSCNSTKAVGLAAGCSLNSDCNSPLVCVFGLCHAQCAAQRDCPTGQICIGAGSEDVCELPGEGCTTDSGSTGGECKNSLVCAGEACRNPCSPTSSCPVPGQVCLSDACYDPADIPDGAAGSDGSGSSSGSSGGGSDGSMGDAPIADAMVEAGPLGFVPSNAGVLANSDAGLPDGSVSLLEPDGGIDFAGAVDVTITGTVGSAALPPALVVTQSDNSLAHLYVMKSLTVNSSAVLTPTDTVPVIFWVLGPVDITGTINVAANTASSEAGATTWQNESTPQGLGAGINGVGPNYPGSGGGGGSYCGVGGTAGATSGPQAKGGSAYGSAAIVPLAAGSAGGYVVGYAWGAGGGAVQISSGTSIIVRGAGIIDASGGGGNLGGGGSGGAILLEAPTITIEGVLAANGGGGGAYTTSMPSQAGQNGPASSTAASGGPEGAWSGGAGGAGTTVNGTNGTSGDAGANLGSGGGGAGFIRLNSTSGMASVMGNGTVSPALTTPCATQGML